MDNTGNRQNSEISSEIMPDGLIKEHSGLHYQRFYNSGKKLKKTSKSEIFAKSEERKVKNDLN